MMETANGPVREVHNATEWELYKTSKRAALVNDLPRNELTNCVFTSNLTHIRKWYSPVLPQLYRPAKRNSSKVRKKGK